VEAPHSMGREKHLGLSRDTQGHHRQGGQRSSQGEEIRRRDRGPPGEKRGYGFGWWPRMTGTRDLELTGLLVHKELGCGRVEDFGPMSGADPNHAPQGQPQENFFAHQGLPPPSHLGMSCRVRELRLLAR
jgi:hypothetical protein